ncbi:DUF21 domain-containing protein At2g14520-like [Coffea arabica]|uniref:DUF21 domain-containing protein At2g14520-like n=1 Tax=Coffea arabica TaxID=13443 RepID=A0A6P6W3D1_COFAR|nr:DUF21 domain-containing protein At2g14520-like [Coffea arabica]
MREDDIPCCEPKFWVYLTLCLVLVTFAGLTSGLSLGLFSYSQVDLEVLMKAGLPHEKKNAARILPIVKNEYLHLCTLLIAKSLALEALPIFLDQILPFWAAIIVSVTFVLAFTEVIPQAVCSRHGLSLSAKFVFFVRFLLLVVFPVSYPVSKLLDWLLGKGHAALLRRAQLKTLVDLLSVKAGKGGELTDDETTIINGALDMTEKTAKDAMTPISKTFSLDINSILDMHTMGLIMSKGHSRIPIHSDDHKNVIGLVLVKNLIFCNPEDKVPLRSINLRRIPRVYDDWPLYDVLKLFQKGHSHMAVVVKSQRDGKETEEQTKESPKFMRMQIDSNSEPAATDVKGTNHLFGQVDLSITSAYCSDNEAGILVVENTRKQEDVFQASNKWEEDSLETLKTKYLDEEVIGIITMGDVMEELLQEEILDETDLNVHNKMSSLPWKRAPSSPTTASVTRIQWRTPASSPFSSYYNTPVLRSPVLPYVPSPVVRPVLYASPGRSISGSPSQSGSLFPVRSSPSSQQVSRNSYERLRPAGNFS